MKSLDEYLRSRSNIDPITNCWNWDSPGRNGYGRGCWNNINEYAHRLAWIGKYGDITPEQKVCHKCDNSSCINTDHLFISDQLGNIFDRDKKGRQARGIKIGSAKLTEQQVRDIRNDNRPAYKIAPDYGVSSTNIHDIKVRRTWTHIT